MHGLAPGLDEVDSCLISRVEVCPWRSFIISARLLVGPVAMDPAAAIDNQKPGPD